MSDIVGRAYRRSPECVDYRVNPERSSAAHLGTNVRALTDVRLRTSIKLKVVVPSGRSAIFVRLGRGHMVDEAAPEDVSLNSVVEAFIANRGMYETFRSKLDSLLSEILNAHGINFHIVESRVKTVESFKEKFSRSGKSYKNPLSDMPDICGCRIITYYYDDVAKIAEILKAEFNIIEEELSHQQSSIDADRFGYLSAHYVVKVGSSRAGLLEWKSFKSIHAEIQIRTVVQHAWSAVSHALQYKSETQIPSALRRRLYRIAGLFELADEEFVGIRDQRAALNATAKKLVKSGKTSIPLSSSSIFAFSQDWFEKVGSRAFSEAGFELMDNPKYADDYVVEIYDLAVGAGLTTVAELSSAFDFDVKAFAISLRDKEMERVDSKIADWKISPLFASLLVSMRAFREQIDESYMEEHEWGEERGAVVLEVIRTS